MIDPAYCQNCGAHYESIPKDTPPFFHGFIGWDYAGHKCKNVLERFKEADNLNLDQVLEKLERVDILPIPEDDIKNSFLQFNEEGREFKNKEQELKFRGAVTLESHIYILLMDIDSFLDESHPIRHGSSYTFLKKQIIK